MNKAHSNKIKPVCFVRYISYEDGSDGKRFYLQPVRRTSCMSSFCLMFNRLRGYLVNYRNTRFSTTTNLKLKVVTECPGNPEQGGGGGDLQSFYCNSKRLLSISRRQLELFSRLHWFDGYRPVQMIQMISIDNWKWNTKSWSSIIHKKFPTLIFRFNFFCWH